MDSDSGAAHEEPLQVALRVIRAHGYPTAVRFRAPRNAMVSGVPPRTSQLWRYLCRCISVCGVFNTSGRNPRHHSNTLGDGPIDRGRGLARPSFSGTGTVGCQAASGQPRLGRDRYVGCGRRHRFDQRSDRVLSQDAAAATWMTYAVGCSGDVTSETHADGHANDPQLVIFQDVVVDIGSNAVLARLA